MLIPLYVALSTHHYHMFPLQILYVLIESRSKVPFSPFWEAVLMLLVIEIIKEASVRMPTKSSSTLGVISGIVIGEAAVQAGFVSKVLIVLVGISTVASFLVPNYIVAKGHTMIHFTMLVFSACLGFFGLTFGMIGLFVHLNGLTSLKQPYFAPITPLYWRDWLDLFIRSPLIWLKKRPEYLHPLQKWRYVKRR
ncbi:spore germination protein [Bacillus licheniformis]|nr:spore germination protein [Bacillus licheniformis]